MLGQRMPLKIENKSHQIRNNNSNNNNSNNSKSLIHVPIYLILFAKLVAKPNNGGREGANSANIRNSGIPEFRIFQVIFY